jgi:hypothetical protein
VLDSNQFIETCCSALPIRYLYPSHSWKNVLYIYHRLAKSFFTSVNRLWDFRMLAIHIHAQVQSPLIRLGDLADPH